MGPRPLRQHPYSLGLPPLSNIENKEGFSWLLPRRAPKAPNLFPLPPPFSVLFLPPFPPSFDSNSFLLPRYPVCPDVCLLLLFPLPLFPPCPSPGLFFGYDFCALYYLGQCFYHQVEWHFLPNGRYNVSLGHTKLRRIWCQALVCFQRRRGKGGGIKGPVGNVV